MSVKDAIDDLKNEITTAGIVPENGLGDELFLFSSTLSPVVNVDLIIFNNHNQVLLTWRDDPYTGIGWHIPGGCIRIRETIETRIQATAMNEIGAEVDYIQDPIAVYEVFNLEPREGIPDQNERSHFITLAYICRLKNPISLNERMQWFDDLPDDLLKCQDCYRNDWQTIKNKAIRWVL